MRSGIFTNWAIQRTRSAILRQPEQPKAWSKLYSLFAETGQETEWREFCQTRLGFAVPGDFDLVAAE